MDNETADISKAPAFADWVREFKRTTGRNAVVVSRGAGWFFAETGGFPGAPMRRAGFVEAAARLAARPDFEQPGILQS